MPAARHPRPAPLTRGRGAQANPANRFETLSLHVLPDHVDEIVAENPDGTQVRTLVYADRARTIINRVDSPDIPCDWSVNPYRGCEHGCVYCYARPHHEMLGFSCGLDFETRIVAKHDAPDLLRRELASPKWRGEPIMISGVTDPYQPVERKLQITRRILEICADAGQPVSIITKNAMVTRDVDLLSRLAALGAARVAISLTSLDNRLASSMEPRASAPQKRLEAMRALSSAGIPVTVMTAPIIPGLNDREIPALLQAAAGAGATSAGYVFLRLPHQVKTIFFDWLHREFPDRVTHVESLLRQSRHGDLTDSTFGRRMTGEGPVAQMVKQLFKTSARRIGVLPRPSPMQARRLTGITPLPDAYQPMLF
jgi:DNA repair photolyase